MSITKSIYFPDKTFVSKEALFKALKDNETLIIDTKKSIIYDGIGKAALFGSLTMLKNETEIKGIGFTVKENHMYPIISTCNFFDSHKDVHLNNSMNKTAKDQQGKVYYCADHQLNAMNIIAYKSDVSMMIKEIDWSLVGKDYSGKTQALIFEIDKSKITKKEFSDLIEKEKDLQNSIRMRYISIKMGIDSTNKEYAINKQFYDTHIKSIVNKDEVEKEGYFFGIEELAIVSEGSLVVAGGSNSATGIYQSLKVTGAGKATPESIEPPIGTQKQISIINNLKFY